MKLTDKEIRSLRADHEYNFEGDPRVYAICIELLEARFIIRDLKLTAEETNGGWIEVEVVETDIPEFLDKYDGGVK